MGTNELIKRGAKLVQSVEDILEELPPTRFEGAAEAMSDGASSAGVPRLDECETGVLNVLSEGALTVDQLLRIMSNSPGEIMRSLIELELKGLVAREPGGLVRAKLV